MRQPSLLRRYILFFCGVLCAALGIALITLAGMGTSAVSSLPYVLTLLFPALSPPASPSPPNRGPHRPDPAGKAAL